MGNPLPDCSPSMPAVWLMQTTFIAIPVRGIEWKRQLRPSFFRRLRSQPFSTWLGWMVTGRNRSEYGIFIDLYFQHYAISGGCYTADNHITRLMPGMEGNTLSSRPRVWKLLLTLVGVLILASILISLLTNFQNADWLFKTGNPQLYQTIEQFFTGK